MRHHHRTHPATTPRWLYLLPILAVVLAAACGGGGADPSSPEVAAGQDQFRKVCATCHGMNAEGMPRLGKELVNNEFIQTKSDAELVQFLKEGRPATHPDNTRGVDMPPKGGNPAITEQDLQNIVSFLRTLQ